MKSVELALEMEQEELDSLKASCSDSEFEYSPCSFRQKIWEKIVQDMESEIASLQKSLSPW